MNKQETQHTPTPWAFDGYSITDESGKTVSNVFESGAISVAEQCANARMIVRAVNAHADLVAALELIHANAAESPEWIRARIAPALAKAKGDSQ